MADATPIEAHLPDGSVHQFPAGTPPEVIDKAVKSYLAGDKPAEQGTGDRVLHLLGLAGSALARGAASTPAALIDTMARGEARAYMKPEDAAKVQPGALAAVQRTGVQPQTQPERYANMALQGAGGALTGPGAIEAPLIAAGTGAASGLGSEVAAKIVGDTPMARLVGAIVGGHAVNVPRLFTGNTADLARETVGTANPADVRSAGIQMARDRAAGVPTNLSQAMPNASNIDNLVAALARSKYGEQIQSQLNAQPRQVDIAATNAVGRLPGNVVPQQAAANSAQDAATAAIEAGRRQASAAWAKHAEPAAAVSPDSVAALDKHLQGIVDANPNTNAAEIAQSVQQSLRHPNPTLETGPYLTNALQLKNAVEDALGNVGPRKLNTPGLNAKDMRTAAGIRDQLRGVFEDQAPSLVKANDAYANVMDTVVDPMKKSVVGRVAGRTGASEDVEAPAKVFSVFDKGTDPTASGTSDILTLEKNLRGQDPEAFPTAAKTWLSKKLYEALPADAGGPSPQTALNLKQALIPNATAEQGLKDTIAGIGRSQGMNAKDQSALVNGFMNVVKTISNASKRPSQVGIGGQELAETASGNLVSNFTRLFGFLPLERVAHGVEKYYTSGAYKQLDRLLTTPEGVDTLMKLSRTPMMSKSAENLINSYLGGQATVQSGPQSSGG